MDISTDIWGQLAVEASQVYLSDGTVRSPFADTVRLCLKIYVSSLLRISKLKKIIVTVLKFKKIN